MNKLNETLSGVGNSLLHQLIISDLIFAVRKMFAKRKKKDMLALSEISLSRLGYECGDSRFAIEGDYNYDFAVVERGMLKFVLEIERKGQYRNKTQRKLKKTIEQIADIEEVMLIEIDEYENKLRYFHYVYSNGKIIEIETSSKSEYLDMVLANSLKKVFASGNINSYLYIPPQKKHAPRKNF